MYRGLRVGDPLCNRLLMTHIVICFTNKISEILFQLLGKIYLFCQKVNDLLSKKEGGGGRGATTRRCTGSCECCNCFKVAAFTLGSAIASTTKQFIGLE